LPERHWSERIIGKRSRRQGWPSRGIERSRAEKQALKQHTKKAERQRIQGEGHRRDFANEIEFNHAAAGGHADDPIPTRPNSRSALADQRRGAE
jgi:hypothetical protein